MLPKGFAERFVHRHLFKILMGGSCIGGYVCYQIVLRRMPSLDENGLQQYDDISKRDMSQQEALLRGMVQNALESSPRENLQNAMDANERFMLPGRPAERPAFLNKVEANGRKIMEEHNSQRQRQTQEPETNNDQFSTYSNSISEAD